ncbi:chloroplast oxygen-evolving complex/thylakoid lumenal 25.6kDa protein [Dunaliella salina]|uniref:Chloroplast oxygen-evolving complex/thylakoid lumenal 25.6kDa protein n=1 Tax=Dunaliella salina TaxID=3046 RepID=A0ABQ7GY33_DUNSA|nr:chloroplast oxygen-evolving complex/thylakoid lumenal 25.6kDa protein [Dunaliella salina]|eukprot:KAF5839511.1 chloroplast oxygen-evolving complex/thylakoid lumenal 25.6kDa protein [Dunaliella salina]
MIFQQQCLAGSRPSHLACSRSFSTNARQPAIVRHASSSHSQAELAEPCAATPAASRRQLLGAASLASALLTGPQAALAAAKTPKGFSAFEDVGDGYKFLYPFGWQEVAVDGADVVFKDIVEPLEYISVTITTTEKTDIAEFGTKEEVADTLAKEVLTPPGQEVNILSSEARDLNNRNYFEFEFTAKNPRYTRHALAVVAVANGKFYTLTTGANEKRWGRISDRLKTSIRSFTLLT